MPLLSLLFVVCALALANPYPDPNQVPKDLPYKSALQDYPSISSQQLALEGIEILRFDIAWADVDESYHIARVLKEKSGTPGLLNRAKKKPVLGSYIAQLVDPRTDEVLAWDSMGTGQEFRLLVRGMTFRFPMPATTVKFRLFAEHPTTAEPKLVIEEMLVPSEVTETNRGREVQVKELKPAVTTPGLAVNLYAEGYLAGTEEEFFTAAQRVVDALKTISFPGLDQMQIRAVFSPSEEKLGSAVSLGLPVPEKKSFLTLFFPYWDNFGRWYHVVYPTREAKYRDALASVPYDYPVALLDNASYWGVGNFNELTAIPVKNTSFTYLLLHEFGHFFGLNEEYEGGGKTELAFAPGVTEPWSQNITFDPHPERLKWKASITPGTAIPTPSGAWTGNGPFGAYKGGYADTEPFGKSHKPGKNCIMLNGKKFCPICQKAIQDKVDFDLK